MSSPVFRVQIVGLDRIQAGAVRFRRIVFRRMENAAKRGLRATIKSIKQDIRTQSRLGRSIWGRKGVGLNKLVQLGRPRSNPLGLEMDIKLTGIPAMLEKGGRFKPHEIAPKNRKALRFKGSGVFAKRVSHPGAQVQPHRFAAEAVERDAPKIIADVTAETNKAISEVFGV